MHGFIYNSLKQMLNSTYLSLLFLYGVICWMVTDMAIKSQGFVSGKAILKSYDTIVLFLVLINCIYFIITHFRESLNSRVRDAEVVRLGKFRYFWGLIATYFIYFVVFNVLPLYLTAFVQNIISSTSAFQFSDYIFALLSTALRAGFWPIVLSVILIVWIKNDLMTLIAWTAVYLMVTAISVISGLYKTGDGSTPLSTVPLIANIAVSILTIGGGFIISRRLTEYDYNEKISGGIFPYIAHKLRFVLSEFHYKMLGLKTQSLYLIFGLLGFAFVLSLTAGMGANNTVISKIYVAVFFPLLFSFNQYNLLAVDIESGMIVTNVLRKTGYSRVVMNRWFTMLLPQAAFAVIFSFFLASSFDGLNISFLVLVVMLNLLFSSMNFSLSVFFMRPGFANFTVGFIAYLMLREDVQTVISSSKLMSYVNVFGSITSFTNNTPALSHILIALFFSVMFILLAFNKLKKIDITAV
ncbi:MAG: hypothetical protein HF312_08710 [Ignavibacteria bacterium]|jgi:hypothetical protein|nr:hypothetical protein [Ignavibacteria bacterium]MCU7520282.1 hypothetical protein [Ignavibacteria bacterium]